MKTGNLIPIVLAVVVAISLGSIWFYPSIQDFMHANPFWNGLKTFYQEVDASPVDSLSAIAQRAESSVLVVIPYVRYNQQDTSQLRIFVENGWTAVVLDDYGYGNDLLEGIGLEARFSGHSLLDPLFSYKNPSMPRITDFDPKLAAGGIHSLVFNHATALQDTSAGKVIAWSSSSSFLDQNENGSRDENESKGPYPVAAAFSVGTGTVLAISDPSILISSMVGRDDNRLFLRQLLATYAPGQKVFVDSSRLPKSPLDESKSRMTAARERIANPYSVSAILGLAVVLVLRPFAKGRQN